MGIGTVGDDDGDDLKASRVLPKVHLPPAGLPLDDVGVGTGRRGHMNCVEVTCHERKRFVLVKVLAREMGEGARGRGGGGGGGGGGGERVD